MSREGMETKRQDEQPTWYGAAFHGIPEPEARPIAMHFARVDANANVVDRHTHACEVVRLMVVIGRKNVRGIPDPDDLPIRP